MVSEAQQWWTQQYPTLSLHDLHTLPIFSQFKAEQVPYSRDSAEFYESFALEADGATFEKRHKTKSEGEKLSHVRATDTWFYEKRTLNSGCEVMTRTWRSPEAEWGTVEQRCRGFEVREEWRLQASDRRYERCTLEEGVKRGVKTGSTAQESWVEVCWESGEESECEKVWRRGQACGGESKHVRGAYWWGDTWQKTDDRSFERKSWHTEGEHDWGNVHGAADGKTWQEKWDITKARRCEERLQQEGDRVHGFRYAREGEDWCRQEWDGRRPPESVSTHQLSAVLQLNEAYTSVRNALLRSESTVEQLLSQAPAFTPEFDALQQARFDLSAPNSSDCLSLLAALQSELELLDKHELLKQRLVQAVCAERGKTSAQLLDLYDASLTTYQALATAVKAEQWTSEGNGLDALLDLEREKTARIATHVHMPQTEVNQAVDEMYALMTSHDAIFSAAVELTQDGEVRGKMNELKERLEDVYAEYRAKQQFAQVRELLTLWREYQSLHLQVWNRICGWTEQVDDSFRELSSDGTATPFQRVDRDLNRLIPFMLQLDTWLHASLETRRPMLVADLSSSLRTTIDAGASFEVVVEKAALLAAAAAALEQPASGIYETMLQFTSQIDQIVTKAQSAMKLGQRPGDQSLASKLAQLESFCASLISLSADVSDSQEQEAIIALKSAEIAQLTVRLDQKCNEIAHLEADFLRNEGQLERETEPLKEQIVFLEAELARVKEAQKAA